MADQKRQTTAESHQSVSVTLKRSMTRRQAGDRNYPTLQSGKVIIKKYTNNALKTIERNYRKFSK